MARSYRYLHYDVFTDRLFGGNQLAVVLDGRGLPTETMQAIAKEMNFSETTFVLPAENTATDVRLRIFTPGEELPTAGHPTIGSTFALARCGVIARGRRNFVFGQNAGPTPVTMTWTGDDLSFVWMTQALPSFGDPIPDPARTAAALTLSPAAVAGTGKPVQVVSCGVPFMFVPLTTRSAVDSVVVDGSGLGSVFRAAKISAHGVFVFSAQPGGKKATVYSRMFAPEMGIVEDPATGIASGPLGCYLVRHGMVPPAKAGAMVSLQGVKMGRPSHVHISIGTGKNSDIVSVRVGGAAVLAGEGTLYV
ncbi:MAG TPA: PhzF family phenazine biosynthesis protein [Vicinamibacterales bacterium]|nr:PhzF family phenazine biosynthesis protein [Vicinamibacterales bacterium]